MPDVSAREFDVFRLLTEGRLLTEVASVLSLSSRSMANYQTRIKRKLGVSTTAGLAHVASATVRCRCGQLTGQGALEYVFAAVLNVRPRIACAAVPWVSGIFPFTLRRPPWIYCASRCDSNSKVAQFGGASAG